jgi:glycoside/pentoside/hexuronide:cation symporter, GPH family
MTTTRKQRWLYSLINLGMAITVQSFSAYVIFYYVDVKRLDAVWAATVMGVFAFYNALNNPLLGYLSDRTRSRWGRRIPYLLFGGLPMAVTYLLVFAAPFDGVEQPVALLIYFAAAIVIWEGLHTAISTGYYSLLPEMFPTYRERTEVAAPMNLIQTIALMIGIALPPVIYSNLGWPAMGLLFAVLATVAIYVGARGLFERPRYGQEQGLPFLPALQATFLNRSFVTLVAAQTLRFTATNTLLAGMAFYAKYSLRVDEGNTSLIFGVVFLTAMPALWLWKAISRRFSARTTLMLAYAMLAVSVLPLYIAGTLMGAMAAAAGIGLALAGLILMGDVILADVIDEDAVRTGQRREGMYFGMSGLIITLSTALVSLVFGLIAPAYGYNSALEVQPETVATGFRVFMTVPSFLAALLAVLALALYPLHGERLAKVKAEMKDWAEQE